MFTKEREIRSPKDKSKRKSSLSKKFILYMAGFITTAMVVQGGVSVLKFKSQSDQILQREAKVGLDSAYGRVTEYLNGYSNQISALATNQKIISELVNGNPDFTLATFKAIKDSDPAITGIYTRDEKKHYETYPRMDIPDGDMSKPESALIQKVKSTQSKVWSEAYLDETTNVWMVSVLQRVQDNNKTIGYVGFDISLVKLSEVVNSMKIGQDGYFALADPLGIVLAHKNQDLLGKEITIAPLKEAITKNDVGEIKYKDGKEPIITQYNTLPEGSFKLYTIIRADEYTKDLYGFALTSLIALLIITLTSTGLNSVIIKKILQAIKNLQNDMFKIEQGDLTVRTHVMTNDEIGDLAKGFNNMVENLKELIAETSNVTNTLSMETSVLQEAYSQAIASSEEVARSVQEIANVTQAQSGETEDIVSESARLSGSIEGVSKAIGEVVNLCDHVQSANETGLDTVNKLVIATGENTKVTNGVLNNVQNIADSSKQINTVLETITEIANKTNLLSLNASIEAARAGDAGRGFAVVAGEIRKLAEQSKVATENIKSIVTDINSKTEIAVNGMENAKGINDNQINVVRATEESFKNISESLDKLVANIVSINDRNKEMVIQKDKIEGHMQSLASGMEQVSASTQEISASTEEQLAMMNEVNSSTEQFEKLAESLKSQIGKFKV